MRAGSLAQRSTRGFTLLEYTIALVVVMTLGYSLVLTLGVGHLMERTVIQVAEENQAFRKAVNTLTEELRTSRDSTVSIQTLADGNHQIRFMMPIVVGEVTSWGVHDRTLGSDPASQSVPGWSVRYTVRDQATGNGTAVKQLVRQILDAALVVRKETVLATGLRSGAVNPPGFRVVRNGAIWEVTLTTEGLVSEKTMLGGVFHVRTRN